MDLADIIEFFNNYLILLCHFSFQSRYSRDDIFLALNFQCGSKTVIFQTFSASRFCIISQCNACLICATLAISAWNGSVHLSSQFQNTITTYLSISFSSQCREIRDSKCSTWFLWWRKSSIVLFFFTLFNFI